ncbi:MAG TPA: hypothetical protein V6C52_03435 [Coleofasciculaceae cyanobacterium]|jgi:hypothetical protein
MLKRYFWQKQTGQSLIEYVVSGALIGAVCIVGLMITGKDLNDQLKGLTADMKKSTGNSTINANAIASSLKGVTTAPDEKGLSTVTIKLSSGEEITLEQYPADLNKSVATSGANGTTEMLLANFDSFVYQVKAADNLTPEQNNILAALSNQGHKMADIIKKGEILAASTGDPKEVSGVVWSLGWSPSMGYFDDSKPLLDLYNQADTSGALADPAVKSVVSTLVSQILNISNGVETAAWSLASESPSITLEDFWNIAARDLNETGLTTPSTTDSLLSLGPSMVVHQDSAGICAAGSGKDSGKKCTAMAP